MEWIKKIGLFVFSILCLAVANAQNESPLQPLSNPVLINPAFAGLDNLTKVYVGNQFYHVDSTESFNLLYVTYNTYSDKLKGGIGIFFQQGIIGSDNIGTSEIGFAYSGFPKKTENGNIRFGLNANFLLATKQWFVSTLDKIMIDPELEPNPPGRESLRYLMIKPRFSFLWDSHTVRWGLTAGIPLKLDLASDGEKQGDVFPANATLYIAKSREGYKKGLKTKPYVFIPELIVFYQEDFILSRFHAYIEHTSNTMGAFLQSDFTNNIHILGGTFGIAQDNFRIDLSAGAGIPGISDEIGISGELTLQLVVPRIDYSKINPWATKRK